MKEENLENIYYSLLMAGAGEDVASKVISDKNLLDKYKILEQKGCLPLEIAVICKI